MMISTAQSLALPPSDVYLERGHGRWSVLVFWVGCVCVGKRVQWALQAGCKRSRHFADGCGQAGFDIVRRASTLFANLPLPPSSSSYEHLHSLKQRGGGSSERKNSKGRKS